MGQFFLPRSSFVLWTQIEFCVFARTSDVPACMVGKAGPESLSLCFIKNSWTSWHPALLFHEMRQQRQPVLWELYKGGCCLFFKWVDYWKEVASLPSGERGILLCVYSHCSEKRNIVNKIPRFPQITSEQLLLLFCFHGWLLWAFNPIARVSFDVISGAFLNLKKRGVLRALAWTPFLALGWGLGPWRGKPSEGMSFWQRSWLHYSPSRSMSLTLGIRWK